MIVAGSVASRRGWVGPAFWAALAGGAAVFVTAVHVGPAAGDSVTAIADQHSTALAGTVALGVLAVFVVALVLHCAYELRLAGRRRQAAGREPRWGRRAQH